jgi:hypothetical protein
MATTAMTSTKIPDISKAKSRNPQNAKRLRARQRQAVQSARAKTRSGGGRTK